MIYFVPMSLIPKDKPDGQTTQILLAINQLVSLVPQKSGTIVNTTSGEAYHVSESVDAIRKLDPFGQLKVIGG